MSLSKNHRFNKSERCFISFQYKKLTRKRRNRNTKRLFQAIQDSNLPLVKLLLKAGVRINARDAYDRTFLHVSAVEGKLGIARRLLRHGCKVNALNCVGDTALHEAIAYDNKRVARYLIRSGANVRRRNCNGDTPLHLAVIHQRDLVIVKMILRRGVNLSAINYFGYSALHHAIESKNVRVIELLLSNGARVNSTACKVSALHMATGLGSLSISRELLAAGADVNRKDINDCSPLQCAICTGNVELVKLLLRAGANVNNQNKIGATALHNAIMCGNEEMIVHLLKSGANVGARTTDGDTPLHWVSMLNVNDSHARIIGNLLSRGSDVNGRNASGQTPIHFLVRYGNAKMVMMLMQYGADLTKKDFEGCTTVHYAVYNGDAKVLKLILESGIVVNERCSRGTTALHHAAKQSRDEYIQCLLDKGVDIKTKDNCGRSALYYAITEPYFYGNRLNIVEERNRSIRLLLEHGTDVNESIQQERTILEIAMERRDVNGTNIILEHMAKLESFKAGLSEHNRRIIDEQPETQSYFDTCMIELQTMKERRLFGTVSLYDILTQSNGAIAGYTRNQDLTDAFRISNYESTFPIYCGSLKTQFERGCKRQNVMKKAAIALSNTFCFADPYHVVLEKILNNLRTEEMSILADI